MSGSSKCKLQYFSTCTCRVRLPCNTYPQLTISPKMYLSCTLFRYWCAQSTVHNESRFSHRRSVDSTHIAFCTSSHSTHPLSVLRNLHAVVKSCWTEILSCTQTCPTGEIEESELPYSLCRERSAVRDAEKSGWDSCCALKAALLLILAAQLREFALLFVYARSVPKLTHRPGESLLFCPLLMQVQGLLDLSSNHRCDKNHT